MQTLLFIKKKGSKSSGTSERSVELPYVFKKNPKRCHCQTLPKKPQTFLEEKKNPPPPPPGGGGGGGGFKNTGAVQIDVFRATPQEATNRRRLSGYTILLASKRAQTRHGGREDSQWE